MLGEHPRRGLELLCDTGLARHVVPEVPAMQLETDEHMQHKDVYTHSLVVMEQAIERETDGPDLTLRLAALLHDIGKPATRRKEPDGRVRSITTRWWGEDGPQATAGAQVPEGPGRRRVSARLPAPAVPRLRQGRVDRLGRAPLRRRRRAAAGAAAPAGPLGLHHAEPAPGRGLQRNYDGLENRIAELRKQEELDAIRPDLDGNRIMELLGIPPGPAVGKAYRHMLALRMEQGPMDAEQAEAALRAWAAENL